MVCEYGVWVVWSQVVGVSGCALHSRHGICAAAFGAGRRRDRVTGSVVGSSLPICQTGTCLVYCQAGNWQVCEGGLAEDGRTE